MSTQFVTLPDGTLKEVKMSTNRDVSDTRDYRLKASRMTLEALPQVVDNSKWCSGIEDQGDLGSCFSGDTLVRLLNGEKKSLKELYESKKTFWIYASTQTGKIVPAEARCNLTGRDKSVIKVTLDNNEQITCTPNHEFMLRDGTYCEAQHLTTEMSLMPLYIKYDKLGYQMCFDNESGKYHKTHSIVAFALHSEQIEKIDEDVKCVHHIDFNKKNNSPENLQFMGLREHWMYHASLSTFSFRNWNGTEKQREHSRQVIRKQYDTNPNWSGNGSSKGGTQTHQNRLADPEKMEKWKKEFCSLGHTPEARDKAKKSFIETIKNRSAEKKKSIGDANSQRVKKYLEKPENMQKYQAQMASVGSNSGKTKLIAYAKKILDKHGTLTKDVWTQEKLESGIASFPKFENIINYFENIDALKEAASCYNHKITKIEYVNETMDVYCLEVPQYHNFALAAGVFVHNCTAHAVAGVIEYNDKRFNSKPVNKRISRLFTYYATRILEGTVNEDSGASMRNAIKSVANFGCIRESLWWYNEKKFTVNPPQKLWKAAATDKILSYHRIDDGDLATIKSTLAHGYVIAFGMQVFNAMLTEEVAKSGIVPTPNENETNVGGHAVVLVGYDDTKQMFKVRNSWGKNWGDCGYFWLGYDYVGSRELCNDFWVVVSSVDVS